jgi:hypothetical protein
VILFGGDASNGEKLLASIGIIRKSFPYDVSHIPPSPANLGTRTYIANVPDICAGLSDETSGGVRLGQQPADGDAAITTVSVVTAGSGDTYRIARVYIDRDQAYRFAQYS